MPNKELGIADPVYDALRIRSGQSIAPDLGGGSTGTGGIENKIYVWHADGSTVDTFDATAAGLALAIAAAASGDTVWLPSIPITLTAGITIPAGVIVLGISANAVLSFSGFSGTAVTLSAGSALQTCTLLYDGTGYASATGIAASADGWIIFDVNVYVHGASAQNWGVNGEAVTAATRAFIIDSHFHASGSDARGAAVGDYVSVSGKCTGRTDGTDATSCGLSINSSSGKEAIIEQFRTSRDFSRVGAIAFSASAYLFHCVFDASSTGLQINASSTISIYACEWSSLTNNGTLIYLPGDRSAIDHTHGSTLGSADYAENNTSSPPSESDIIGAFGEVTTVGPGYLGILNDNAEESHVYLCGATIAGWWYLNLARAAALTAISLSILAGDSFTGANGTHLNVHAMDAGAGWTENSGSWTISSNAAVQATASGAAYVVTTEASDANVKIHARVKTQAGSGSQIGGIIARFSDTSNYWQIFYNTNTGKVQINEVNTGSATMRAQKSWTALYQKYIDIDVTLDGNTIMATFDGGYTLTYTSAFNSTATKHGLFEYRDGTYAANTFEDFQVIDLPTYVWTRTGTVLSATESWEDNNVYEPTVLIERNPQVLTADRVMKMWYGGGGWATPGLGYAESDDNGATWTKYTGNPVISGLIHARVVKFDGTYYAYGSNAAGNKITLWTSPDGIGWTSYGDVLSLGAGGQWDDTLFGNAFAWRESLTAYYMLYDARSGSGAWKEGLATSTDGLTWSKSGSNPILSMDGGTVGSSYLRKIGSTYYLWCLRSAPDVLPTWIVRFKSINLTTWTAWPAAPMVTRSGAGEGEDTYVGQDADPNIVEDGTMAYLFFAASADGSQASGAFHIVLATADARAIGGY